MSDLSRIDEALADEERPRAHRLRDARDKTAELLAFLDVPEAARVVDLLPFRGYFTRLFANLVGPAGRVFAAIPRDLTRIDRIARGKLEVEAFAAGRCNVTVISGPAQSAGDPPGEADLFWLSQNYHDLEGSMMGPLDMAAFNTAVFRALRPGGAYAVVDHAAVPGSPHAAKARLHRIDPSVVRQQVEDVGFTLEKQSSLLCNPADPLTVGIFSRGIRYHTSRFILMFRKPS